MECGVWTLSLLRSGRSILDHHPTLPSRSCRSLILEVFNYSDSCLTTEAAFRLLFGFPSMHHIINSFIFRQPLSIASLSAEFSWPGGLRTSPSSSTGSVSWSKHIFYITPEKTGGSLVPSSQRSLRCYFSCTYLYTDTLLFP